MKVYPVSFNSPIDAVDTGWFKEIELKLNELTERYNRVDSMYEQLNFLYTQFMTNSTIILNKMDEIEKKQNKIDNVEEMCSMYENVQEFLEQLKKQNERNIQTFNVLFNEIDNIKTKQESYEKDINKEIEDLKRSQSELITSINNRFNELKSLIEQQTESLNLYENLHKNLHDENNGILDNLFKLFK